MLQQLLIKNIVLLIVRSEDSFHTSPMKTHQDKVPPRYNVEERVSLLALENATRCNSILRQTKDSKDDVGIEKKNYT